MTFPLIKGTATMSVIGSPSSDTDDSGPRRFVTNVLINRCRARNHRNRPTLASRRNTGAIEDPGELVFRRRVISAIARDDQTISRDVRHRLETYGGPGRWTVAVSDGVVAISDAYDDPTGRHVARVITESVPGVARAETIAVVPEQR